MAGCGASTYTWARASGNGFTGALVAYSGVGTAALLSAKQTNTGSSETATAPSVTTSAPNSMIVAFHGISGPGQTYAAGSGVQRRAFQFDDDGAYRYAVAAVDVFQTAAGVSGTSTGVFGAAGHNSGITIALAP